MHPIIFFFWGGGGGGGRKIFTYHGLPLPRKTLLSLSSFSLSWSHTHTNQPTNQHTHTHAAASGYTISYHLKRGIPAITGTRTGLSLHNITTGSRTAGTCGGRMGSNSLKQMSWENKMVSCKDQ